MLNIFLIIMFFAIPIFTSFSQDQQNKILHFSYDVNGNRQQRWVTIEKVMKNDSLDSIKQDSLVKIYSGKLNQERISLLLYPNPTKGILDLKIIGLKEGEIAELCFYSLEGKQLQKKYTSSNLTKIDIVDFISGEYILVVTACSEIVRWKIIKEK